MVFLLDGLFVEVVKTHQVQIGTMICATRLGHLCGKDCTVLMNQPAGKE